MKILVRLSFLVLIPIIVGLGLLLSGHSIGAMILAFGTPAVMIVLVIVGLVMMMKGKLFDNKPKDTESNAIEHSAKEQEQAAIDEVNNSHYYQNKFKLAEYESNHIIEGTKNSSAKGIAIGITFFLMLVADAVLATVFLILQIFVGAIVCAALFGITIITMLITVAIRQAVSMKGDISKAQKFIRGNVKSCIMTDTVTSKPRIATVKIKRIVYRVVINADGAEFEAYSEQFHETDETVVVAVIGKKLVKIIEEADLESQSEEIRSKYNECLNNGETVIIKKPNSAVRTAHNYAHRRRH